MDDVVAAFDVAVGCKEPVSSVQGTDILTGCVKHLVMFFPGAMSQSGIDRGL